MIPTLKKRNTSSSSSSTTTTTTSSIPQPTAPILNGEEDEKIIYTIRAKLYKLQKINTTNDNTNTEITSTATTATTGIQCATKVGNDTNNNTNGGKEKDHNQQNKVDWKEVGIGPLRILVSSSSSTSTTSSSNNNNDDEKDQTSTARIVQRRESTPGGPGTKLILNVLLRKECVVEKRGEKFVKLAAFEVVDSPKTTDENSVKLQTVQYLFKVKTINDADSLLDVLKKYCK